MDDDPVTPTLAQFNPEHRNSPQSPATKQKHHLQPSAPHYVPQDDQCYEGACENPPLTIYVGQLAVAAHAVI